MLTGQIRVKEKASHHTTVHISVAHAYPLKTDRHAKCAIKSLFELTGIYNYYIITAFVHY